MNKSTAIKLTNELLTPYFEDKGWKYKKGKWNCFYNEFDGGFKKFIMNYYDYNPMQRPDFLMVIVHKKVEEIYEQLVTQTSNFSDFGCISIHPESVRTVSTSLAMIMTTEINSAPPVITEDNLLKTVNFIINHIEETGNLIFNQFQDLNKIDYTINGEIYWDTDYQKLFNLGTGKFAIKRTIIAYLCKNESIKKIVNFHLEYWNKNLIEYPDCQILINKMNYLVKLLNI